MSVTGNLVSSPDPVPNFIATSSFMQEQEWPEGMRLKLKLTQANIYYWASLGDVNACTYFLLLIPGAFLIWLATYLKFRIFIGNLFSNSNKVSSCLVNQLDQLGYLVSPFQFSSILPNPHLFG